jgi:dihydrofolate reductase
MSVAELERTRERTQEDDMRKITAGLFISLDGVVEAPQTWHFPYFSDEMMDVLQGSIDGSDAMLLGRRTYEEFAGFWPTAEGDMADHMNGVRKHVVSSTLTSADWANSEIVSGDVETAVKELKEADGKDIAIVGSPTLVRTLLAAGLLDEVSLLIHPISVGTGARLFPEGSAQQKLEVVSSRTLASGVLHVVYRAAKA